MIVIFSLFFPRDGEIASQAGGYLSLYKEDMDSLVWLLVRHCNHLTQRDLTLHILFLGWDLDLDMIAFLLAGKIILQHSLDIIRCSGALGLQPGRTMKLAATSLTGGESEEVRARAELYYRASLDTFAVLERGKTVR